MKNKKNLYRNKLYPTNKWILDIILCICLIPLLVLVACILLLLNYFFNRGTLFFFQNRMGKNCMPFSVIKFRSMVHVNEIYRQFDDPVELERITPLGKFIRKSKLDELPQIINVLKGEMSLIGPRPHFYSHAIVFSEKIKGYQERHDILPGITGLSKIRLGYSEGLQEISNEVAIDKYYIKNSGFIIDLKILLNTIIVIFRGFIK